MRQILGQNEFRLRECLLLASGFRWMLRAGNGQLIAVSEKAYRHDYQAKAAVEKVLAQIRRSGVKGPIGDGPSQIIAKKSDGSFFFRFCSLAGCFSAAETTGMMRHQSPIPHLSRATFRA
jgi:uncharacterized protein YegP (UPF0339 family)